MQQVMVKVMKVTKLQDGIFKEKKLSMIGRRWLKECRKISREQILDIEFL